jgi:hypothetical protein
VGNGAWLVVPLAAAAGLVLALVLDGARGALRAGAQALRRFAPRIRTRVAVVASWHPSLAPAPRRLRALAAAGAGRGPPPVG